MQKNADGSIIYNGDDGYTDVKVNGVSYKNYMPIEIKVHPNGYGYVLLKEDPKTGKTNQYIDGQYENYYINGVVEYTP
jgi:hypothetical protein